MIAARSSIRSLMALGRPLRFFLTPGQEHDLTLANALLEGQTARWAIADRGYDSNGFRSLVASLGAKAVIPARARGSLSFAITPEPIGSATASSAASIS